MSAREAAGPRTAKRRELGGEPLCECQDAFAVARFRWPGRDWQMACLLCLIRAENIAAVLGFALEEERLPPAPPPEGADLRFALIEVDP